MSTQFQVGQAVKAKSTAQGMIAGNVYTIIGVRSQPTPFGDLVQYQITTGRWIQNLPQLSTLAAADELDRQVVAEVCGRQVTRNQLAFWFDKVSDKVNWKNPIDTEAFFDCDYDLVGTQKAIEFFTGSASTFTVLRRDGQGCVYHVKAAGYYATCGA